MKKYDASEILSEAKLRTGLSDFGQPEFLENYTTAISSINDKQEIAQDRWDVVREYFIRLLVNRLRFAKDITDHPEILSEDLKPPVAIVALPRTGSTKLQRMLGVSDAYQNLLWWQMHMFARIPGALNGGVEERISVTKEFEHWVYKVCPDMVKGHPRYAEEPEEEQILNEFMFPPVLSVQFSGADYTEEQLAAQDMGAVYNYMKMQLQYLQWQFHKTDPKPWLLKSPTNLGFEALLTQTFGQDTKIICTHRDPKNVVASIAKTAEYYRNTFSDVTNEEKQHSLGRNMLNALVFGISQHMAWRDANPQAKILDIGFKDITTLPLSVLHDVYAFTGDVVTAEIEKAVEDWETDQQITHKKNEYSLEEFGLTEAEVNTVFAPYIERFQEYL